MEIKKEYLEWAMGDDTGVSSKTMLRTFLNLANNSHWGNGHPSDPSDFGRCYRLLKAFPEFKEKLPKLKKFKGWIAVIDNWEKLVALYEEESRNPNKRAPKLYRLMKDIGC